MFMQVLKSKRNPAAWHLSTLVVFQSTSHKIVSKILPILRRLRTVLFTCVRCHIPSSIWKHTQVTLVLFIECDAIHSGTRTIAPSSLLALMTGL